VSVAFVGFSTNDAGQECLRYRLRNDNAHGIFALAELQNGPPQLEPIRPPDEFGAADNRFTEFPDRDAISNANFMFCRRSRFADTRLLGHTASRRPAKT